MTLPSPIQTGAITGRFLDASTGQPLRGSVILGYDRQVLLADGTTPPVTLIPRVKAYPLDETTGDLAVGDLILSDSPGLRRQGFTMRAKFALTDAAGNKRQRPEVHFRLTIANPERDLTLISSDEPDGGYPVWPDVHEVPAGGVTSQVLTKLSDEDWDIGWTNKGGGAGGGSVNSVNDVLPDIDGNVELDAADLGAQPAGDYVTDTALALALSGYATTAELDDALALYSTTAEAAAALATALANYATIAFVNESIDAITPASIGAQPAGAYASAADLDNVFAIATGLANSQAQPNGIATLDGSGKLVAAQLPAIAITEYLGAVASQAAMLALAGQQGDWATRTDLGTNWIITGATPSQIGSWTQLTYPGSPVQSVAGRTGAVTLSKTDVGLPNVDNTSDLDKVVSTATQAALNTKGTYSKPAGGIPVADLAASVATSLGKADSATQGGYVLPAGGIPSTDMTAAVRGSLTKAESATQGGYVLPVGGIPIGDLSSGVQTSLGKADAAATAASVTTLAGRVTTVEARPYAIGLGTSDPRPTGLPVGSIIARG